jgi:hypothetical protein
MPASTLRSERPLDDSARATVDAAIAAAGGSVAWRTHAGTGRTYGLVELPAGTPSVPADVRDHVTVFQAPIIALAVSLTVPEAIPAVLEAFAGDGRPDGVLFCGATRGGVILEWDPARTAVAAVFALLDVELQRFACGRTAELLAAVPEAIAARIAAEGLRTPEVAGGRVLETLLRERMETA